MSGTDEQGRSLDPADYKERKHYWSIVQLNAAFGGNALRDWEGFSDPTPVLDRAREIGKLYDFHGPVVQQAVIDITANLAYESWSEGGIMYTNAEFYATAQAVHELITCGHWCDTEEEEGADGAEQ